MRIYIYILICLSILSKAQNLVPNSSFETYTLCPNNGGQIEYAVPWTAATATSSTDYFNGCSSNTGVPSSPFGYQYARTGNAYAGIFFCAGSGGREYLQVQLTSPLIQNITYYVEFYVNSSNANVNSHCNNIAANLSITRPYAATYALQTLTPHIMIFGNPIVTDTLNWVQVSGCYTAQGGEEYITIGNFFDNANTQVGFTGAAYYYVDDVKVEAIPGVCVTGVNELNNNDHLQVYPNPAIGNLKITLSNLNNKKKLSVKLVDIVGREVLNESYKEELDISGLEQGIYFLYVYKNDKLLGTRKVIKE